MLSRILVRLNLYPDIMENSIDRNNESLNPQQPLKVDDKQNLFVNTLVIGTVESISQSSGLGLNNTVQSAIDKWAGKQAVDLSPLVGNPIVSNNSFKSAAITIVQSPVTKIYQAPLASLIAVPPAVVKKPANIVPTGLVINGVKSIYDMGSTLSITPSFVMDGNGWKDISKVDFWLTDSKNKRVELPDVTSFVAKDPKDNNSAKFDYTTSLKGIAAGDYKLVAVAYDKFGVGSNQFTQEIAIKTVYQIGFDSSTNKIDASVLNVFTKLNGVQILGKAINNIQSIPGGKVQDFEKGSIFQSTVGTFSLQGTLNNFYKNLSAADKLRLGLPTANETSVGGYWHQSFQNGELQLVQGMPVKWSDLTLIKDRFNLLGGATTLGKSIGTIRDLNGGKVQDFERGSIFAYGNKTVAVTGSISTYYRANSAALGLPVGEEITTGYGKRQDFSNGKTLINSAQFGTQVLEGSLGAYYRGLSETQRNQLGAPYTGENNLGGGNWRQFFKGGTVEWKNNGTGEMKVTPFAIGFDGTAVNTAFTNEFNKVVGWESLGKATGNVRSIDGGKVQDFEKGSLFQTSTGIKVVKDAIGIYFIGNSSQLGLQKGTLRELGNGKTYQEFDKGIVFNSPSGVSAIYGDMVKTYLDFSQLGIPVGAKIDVGNGITRQNLENGAIFSSTQFGTHAVANDFWTLYKGLTIAQQKDFGMPITDPATPPIGGLRQNFQGGFITIGSDYGNHIVAGKVYSYYKTLTEDQQNKLGIPTTDEISEGKGSTYQFFKGGLIKQTISNGQLVSSNILSPFTIGYSGSKMRDDVIKAYVKLANDLGTPTGNPLRINNGYIQDFNLRTLSVLSTGEAFTITQKIADYTRTDKGSILGLATGEGFSQYYGSQMGSSQSFQNGKVFYHPQFGTFKILGNAQSPGSFGDYYDNVLSPAQRGQLGVPTSEEINDSIGKLHQSFQGGTIYWQNTDSTKSTFSFTTESYQPPQTSGGGGVIIISSDGNNNNQPSSNGTISNNGSVITITFDGNNSNNNTSSNNSIQIKGSVGDYYYNKIGSDTRQRLGQAKSNEVSIGTDNWKQDFQNGTIFHGPKGSYLLVGTLYSNYYNVLSDSDRQRLGMPIGNETQNGGYWNQSFENGQLELISNAPVKWNDGGSFTPPQGSPYTSVIIGQYNSEGGQNGRLGSSTSGELSLGNGRIIQKFSRGDILYSNGKANTLYTNGSAVNYSGLSGIVRSDIGLKLRQAPNTSSNYDDILPNNKRVEIDAWTYGESINGYDQWLHVVGTNNWISSYYIQDVTNQGSVPDQPIKIPGGNGTVVEPPKNSGENYTPPISIPGNGQTGSTTPSVVFIQPGKVSQQVDFSLKNQSIFGGGNGLSIGGFIGDDKLFDKKIDKKFDPLALEFSAGVEAGFKLEALASAGTFDVSLPTVFDINWNPNKNGQSIDVSFNPKLRSDVIFKTMSGITLGGSAKFELAASVKSPLGEIKKSFGVEGKFDLAQATLDKFKLPVVLDLGLSATGKATEENNNRFIAEDKAFEGIDLIGVLKMFPATTIPANIVDKAGLSAQLGAQIQQKSWLEIEGFAVDPDGIGNSYKEETIALNGSKTFNFSVLPGQSFNFSPTIRPIVKFNSSFGMAGSFEVGLDGTLIGKSLGGSLLPDQLLKSISFKQSVETPYLNIWNGAKFNAFDFTNATRLNEITAKIG
jgi:uncharacterized protein with LGFP repeats